MCCLYGNFISDAEKWHPGGIQLESRGNNSKNDARYISPVQAETPVAALAKGTRREIPARQTLCLLVARCLRAKSLTPINTKAMSQEQIPFNASLPAVTITTDGCCKPNPGIGSWACVLRFGNAYKEISGRSSGVTTNNRMELLAIISALRALKKPCRVILRTDSKVASAWIQNKIGKKVARDNPDITRMVGEARALCAQHTVTFQWVRGHNGDPDNERCDELADLAFNESSESLN